MITEPERLARVAELGRALLSDLELDRLLPRIVESARELTGARFGALGTIDHERRRFGRMVFSGVVAERIAAIGERPTAQGVLGLVIDDPRPLRLHDVGEHPRSLGFPQGPPVMASFLGVPLTRGGHPYAALYLTERDGGPFTAADEAAVVALGTWADPALVNADAHAAVRRRRDELERALRGFEATTELARATGGQIELEPVLELVAKRARALLDGRLAIVARVEGEEAVIVAAAGEGRDAVLGERLPIDRRLMGPSFATGRFDTSGPLPRTGIMRRIGANAVVFTPMRFRGETLGVIGVYGDTPFSAEDERVLSDFGASAATAVATAESAVTRSLRLSIEAAERERRHWARELHDQTLQELGALRVLLRGARRTQDPALLEEAVDDAVGLLSEAVAELRLLITELRPAALDQLGVAAALEALTDRARKLSSLDIDLAVDLAFERGDEQQRHEADLESTIYRIVQEALTNAVRHARAARVAIEVVERDGEVLVEVRDDGVGFSTDGTARGFGLVGMHERATLAGGEVRVESAEGMGTHVAARLPVRRRSP